MLHKNLNRFNPITSEDMSLNSLSVNEKQLAVIPVKPEPDVNIDNLPNYISKLPIEFRTLSNISGVVRLTANYKQIIIYNPLSIIVYLGINSEFVSTYSYTVRIPVNSLFVLPPMNVINFSYLYASAPTGGNLAFATIYPDKEFSPGIYTT